jgi:hypothetical protein
MVFPTRAQSDFFGGDLPLLAEIVANTAQQLTALSQIFQTGDQSLNLVREINQGINDSLNLARTAYPNADPGIFKGWSQSGAAFQEIESLYGAIAPTKDAPIQEKTDESVAEAISLNNSIYTYSGTLDQVADSVEEDSHAVSPGGAEKLTAQSLAILIHLLSESLRAQATGLKLQAEALALTNHRDKDGSRYLSHTSAELESSLSSQPTNFVLPRF